MSYIKYVEIKTFQDDFTPVRLTLGKVQDLSAGDVGRYATGNSSFKDAVAFVLGEKSSASALKRLIDLAHGNPLTNQSLALYVTLVCNDRESGEKKFTRRVCGNFCEYEINDKAVRKNNYVVELERTGLKVAEKYCLVFEEVAVFFATMSTKELTEMFEEMCGSLDVKAKYERLKIELDSTETKLKEIFQAKKAKYYLFQLFHWKRVKAELERSLVEINARKEFLEKELATKISECGDKKSTLKRTEKEFTEKESKLKILKSDHTKARNCVELQEGEIHSAKERLTEAEDALNAQLSTIHNLETQIEDYQAQILRIKFKKRTEYTDLKEKAKETADNYVQQLQRLREDKITLENKYNKSISQRQDSEIELARVKDELENEWDRIRTISDELSEMEESTTEIGNQLESFKSGKRFKRDVVLLSPEKALKYQADRVVLRMDIEKLRNDVKENLNQSAKPFEIARFNSELSICEDGIEYNVQQNNKETRHWKTHFKNCTYILQNKIKEHTAIIEASLIAMNEINGEMTGISNHLNSMEDEIFEGFCRAQGVANIQEFEANMHQQAKDQNLKRVNLENEIEKLKYQINNEKSKDLKVKITNFADQLCNCEKDLKMVISIEIKQNELLTKGVENVKNLKWIKELMKTDIDNLECGLHKLQKEIADLSSKADLTKCELQKIVIKRHRMLIDCKKESVGIHFENGDWNDVNDSKSSGQFEKEDEINFDFSSLDPILKVLTSNESLERVKRKFKRDISTLRSFLEGTSDKPNEGNDLQVKIEVKNERDDFEVFCEMLKRLRCDFEKIKKERFQVFMQIFNHVDLRLDKIYKDLTKSDDAYATLLLKNLNEPYLDGITYEFLAPGKLNKPMNELTNEEKIVAAMALLFAFQSLAFKIEL